MTEETNNRSVSGVVSTGKDLIAMLRDGMLLFIVFLLLLWPQKVNMILVDAGFEEGSFAGLKWKAKLKESDSTLLEAQATIADLREQNENLSKALMDVEADIPSEEVRADIAKLDQLNTRLAASSARVQAAVKTTTSANAPLIQKVQESAGTLARWGVVYGGDRDLEAAKFEVQTIAPRLGLTNAAIYYRNNSFRSVATTTDRVQAERLLQNARERREDAYIVDMSSWCPDTTERDGYFECVPP